MAQFKFNETISPENNISLFFEHLGFVDKEMTDLLRKNIQKLIPSASSARSIVYKTASWLSTASSYAVYFILEKLFRYVEG